MRRTLLAVATVKLAAIGVYALVLRDRQLRWGATRDEVGATMPGDAMIPVAHHGATRAITVNADVAEVWPWIAQLGQGRGGFYSYDRLENLAGCEIRSAERIVAAWQHPAVGDEFRLHPEVRMRVALVDPARALVVAGITPGGAEGSGTAGPPYDFTWAFVLAASEAGRTRLVVRERYGYRSGWAAAIVEPLSVVSFVMSQRMLRGIRDRAERAPGH